MSSFFIKSFHGRRRASLEAPPPWLPCRCPRRPSPSSSPVADVASCVSRQQRDPAVLAPCSDDCSSVAAARRLAGPAHRLAVAARRSSSPAGPARRLDGCSKNQLLKKLVPNLLQAVPAKSNARCSKIKTWFQQKAQITAQKKMPRHRTS